LMLSYLIDTLPSGSALLSCLIIGASEVLLAAGEAGFGHVTPDLRAGVYG
jgi:hypothetical protein